MASCALSEVPNDYRKSADTMSRFLKGRQDAAVWLSQHKGRPALLALTAERIFVSSAGSFGGGIEKALQYRNIERFTITGPTVALVANNGDSLPMDFTNADAANQFFAAASAARQAGQEEARQRALTAEAAGGPPVSATSKVLIVTTNDVPGYEIVAVHGDVFGLTVRARNAVATLGAGLKGIVGGEIKGFTSLLTASRNEARDRLATEAVSRGANAVVAMRFDCNEIADVMSEVAAYGTAVTIRPIEPPDEPQ